LARALDVSDRTIRRDVQVLKAAGHMILTRGQVKGVGRGQTHKVRIIELWLDREGYEGIARRMYHSPQSIKRYIDTFLRMVLLHSNDAPVKEIAFVTGSSEKLTKDYLELYEAARQVPHRCEKLEEELERVRTRQKPPVAEAKKGEEQP
jgi:hypothetical protein